MQVGRKVPKGYVDKYLTLHRTDDDDKPSDFFVAEITEEELVIMTRVHVQWSSRKQIPKYIIKYKHSHKNEQTFKFLVQPNIDG